MTQTPKKSAAGALLAASLFSLITACGAPRGAQNTYRGGDGFREMERVENNGSLAHRLEVADPITRVVDERMHVQFELVSKTSSLLSFQWQMVWYDADGFVIDDRTKVWNPVQLGGYGQTTITQTAPTPAAKQWKLEVSSRNEVQ